MRNKSFPPNYEKQFLKPNRKLNGIGKPATFGDFVRKQLENPKSELSVRVEFFRNHCKKVKAYPKIFGFGWFAGLPIYKEFHLDMKFYPYNYKDMYYPSFYKDCIADFR
jgi:hypothetical protein